MGAWKGVVKAGASLPNGIKSRVASASVKCVIVQAMKLWGDEGSGGVEDERDRGGVMRGVA